MSSETVKCHVCDGSGLDWGETCIQCGGKGKLSPEGEFLSDEDEAPASDEAVERAAEVIAGCGVNVGICAHLTNDERLQAATAIAQALASAGLLSKPGA